MAAPCDTLPPNNTTGAQGMEQRAIFDNPAQAVNVLWAVMGGLASLVGWLALALLHTALLALVLLALWATQTTPADVMSFGRQMLQTWPAAALGAAGASAATVLGAWWWVLKRVHRATAGLIADYVLPKPDH